MTTVDDLAAAGDGPQQTAPARAPVLPWYGESWDAWLQANIPPLTDYSGPGIDTWSRHVASVMQYPRPHGMLPGEGRLWEESNKADRGSLVARLWSARALLRHEIALNGHRLRFPIGTRDRDAAELAILFKRHRLEHVESEIIQRGTAAQAPPATGLIANMSPGVRTAAAVSMVAYFGVVILKASLHPIPYAPPPVRAPINGPGIGIQSNIFLPDDDTKARQPSTRTRYSAPYTVTHVSGKGAITSTQHGARYTVTTTR